MQCVKSKVPFPNLLSLFSGLITFPLLLFSLSSCEVFDPEEEAPAFIRIQNPKVVLDENTGFKSDLGIKDFWVYHNGELTGIYPSPVIFPYTNIANTSFFMDGGIFESGQSSFRVPYPFWQQISLNVNQSAGDTFLVEPVFHYKPDTEINIRIDEGFEQSINFQPFFNFSDTARMYRTQNDAFMGDWCSRVRFKDGSRYFNVTHITPDPLYLEINKDIYAEITYKGNVELLVGIVYTNSTSGSVPLLFLTPKAEWTTVYVHLVQEVRGILAAEQVLNTNFRLWLRADGNDQEGELFLDNIRLIHFQ